MAGANKHAEQGRKTTAPVALVHCFKKGNKVFAQKTDEPTLVSPDPTTHNPQKNNNILPFAPVGAKGAKTNAYITSRKDRRKDLSNRTTIALDKRQCRELVESWLFAEAGNTPLNRLITISVGLLDLPETIETFRAALLGYLQKWQRDRYGKPSYIWVIECGKLLGLHLHVAAHTADADILSRDLQRWIRRRAGIRGNLPRGAFHSEALKITCLTYLLKGADPAALRYLLRTFRIEISPEPQGCVAGKRYGVSRSLQQKARNEAKFDAVKALSDLRLLESSSPQLASVPN